MADLTTLSGAILDAIDEPALIIRNERTVTANRAALNLLGAGIVGRDFRFAIRHPLALDAIQANGEAEIDLVGIGSADRPWHLTSRVLADGSMLVRLSDRSQLIAAERMRTDFVANASHELRTPLATIIGYAETLAEQAPLDEATRARFGETIQYEARRMLRIVEDLMSLSRIEADRFCVPNEVVDLGELARLAIEHAALLPAQRECAIESEIAPGETLVLGDFAQLLQLTDNLIANALRYGCSATPCRVEVEVQRVGERALLIMRDHGDGIEPEHLPRLTERFYRIEAARSRDSGGTGLGLAIAKHIVERHRGTLDIRSILGSGTEVTVSLPLVCADVIKR